MGAAVSPVVAGDTVVCRLHSVAKIVIRVKGRDVTIWLPLLRCKQRAFDVWYVFECGFDMMEERLFVWNVETTVFYLPLSFLFYDLLFSEITPHH